jgi:hypothetical protein
MTFSRRWAELGHRLSLPNDSRYHKSSFWKTKFRSLRSPNGPNISRGCVRVERRPRGRRLSKAPRAILACLWSDAGVGSGRAPVHPGPTSADNHRRRRLDARFEAVRGRAWRVAAVAARVGKFWASPQLPCAEIAALARRNSNLSRRVDPDCPDRRPPLCPGREKRTKGRAVRNLRRTLVKSIAGHTHVALTIA